jgi:hypothetical protein
MFAPEDRTRTADVRARPVTRVSAGWMSLLALAQIGVMMADPLIVSGHSTSDRHAFE